MSLRFYMDENIDSAVTRSLLDLQIDVLTAQADGYRRTPDPIVFDRANELGRLIVSTDSDMLIEAHKRQRNGESFTGVIFWHQQTIPLRVIVSDLELLGVAGEPMDVRDRVIFLPLR